MQDTTMTKKEKLLAKIEELKQEVEKLDTKSKRWRPRTGEKYNYLDSEGGLGGVEYLNYYINSAHVDEYNMFPRGWDLLPLVEAQKIQRAIFEGAMRRGALKEFKRGGNNFCIVCGDGDWLVYKLKYSKYPGIVYFTTSEAAQETLDELLLLGVLK